MTSDYAFAATSLCHVVHFNMIPNGCILLLDLLQLKFLLFQNNDKNCLKMLSGFCDVHTDSDNIIIIIMFYSKPSSQMFHSNSYITTLLWFGAWPLSSQPKYNLTWRKLQRLTKWAAQESEEEMTATVIGVAGKIKFQFIT